MALDALEEAAALPTVRPPVAQTPVPSADPFWHAAAKVREARAGAAAQAREVEAALAWAGEPAHRQHSSE